jgi:glycosyltransferase involved in cell wall biosynthesis
MLTMRPMPPKVTMSRTAVLVKGYPRLSETFIAQEIHGLESRGIAQLIVSLRRPTDRVRHPIHDEIRADVLYLPEYLKDDPARVRAGRRWAQSQPAFRRAWAMFQRDLKRDRTANRWRRFGQACVLAHELPADIDRLHTHYLHTPASVARYAAVLRGLPWSFSAHAKDIWTTPQWELKEKLADADWGVTCTKLNTEYLNRLAGAPKKPAKVELVYHGLDFSRFPGPPDRSGRPQDAVSIISIGRAVEKKGYDILLKALARMADDRRWRFHHIGGGQDLTKLKARAKALGLARRITWHGAVNRDHVIEALAEADLFVLPARIARSGDRDGLPNVLMEAMAMGLPCIGTTVSALPEIIVPEQTGLLVEPEDPVALAGALMRLIDDSGLRLRLGGDGARAVRERFSADPGLDRLAAKLRPAGAEAAA